jgi:hypothetical protein
VKPSAENSLLFDVAPEERDGQKKKARKKATAVAVATVNDESPSRVGRSSYLLASIDGHLTCDRCGTTVIDLVDTRKVDGNPQWLVQCGWGCLNTWLTDPIPGLLDSQDSSPDAMRVRGGRFDGQTFDEIDAAGGRWYIEGLVSEGKRRFLAEAAAQWIASRNAVDNF